jgi:hypothetical protein
MGARHLRSPSARRPNTPSARLDISGLLRGIRRYSSDVMSCTVDVRIMEAPRLDTSWSAVAVDEAG